MEERSACEMSTQCIQARVHRGRGLLGFRRQAQDNACGNYPPYPLLIHSNNFFYRFKPDDAGNVSSVKKFKPRQRFSVLDLVECV